ncbi:hypothetical protein [Silvimonas soli]|uniref:hypothetical protein n=1 Tax=Silvimonas soli TaxID=2980100 RepID=UPI0024B382F1|nr:hypothetical protein [Silvimonas soli]
MTEWIIWHGGQFAPVARGIAIEFQMRDGQTAFATTHLDELDWLHRNMPSDIIAYRIKQTAPEAVSFCPEGN